MKRTIFGLVLVVLCAGFVIAYDGTCRDSNVSVCYKNGATGIAAGGAGTCFLLDDGNAKCQGGFNINYTEGNAAGVAVGDISMCILLNNGNVTCWGSINYTQGNAVGVALGNVHGCFLLSNGNATCWGYNGNGQANNYTGGNAVGIAAGQDDTCYLLNNGNVHCQGYQTAPGGKFEDYLGGNAVGVALGSPFMCIYLSNGNVDCRTGYGLDYNGGHAVGVALGTYYQCILLDDGNVDCNFIGGDQDYGQFADYSGGNAIGVAPGDWHTCFLLSGGNVKCQGKNNYGQANNYTGGNAVCQVPVRYPVTEPAWTGGADLFDTAGNNVVSNTTDFILQIRRDSGAKKMVEFRINNSVDISSLVVDWIGSKTVVSNLGGAPGVTGTHSLYVDNTGSGVFVCPSATTLSQVTSGCAGRVNMSCPGSSGAYSCTVEGTQYKVTGLTGSGIGSICDHCDDCDSGLFCNLTATIPTCENRTVYNPPACMDCLDNDVDGLYDYIGYNATEAGDTDCASNLGATETGNTPESIPEFSTFALLAALGIVIAGVVMRRRA